MNVWDDVISAAVLETLSVEARALWSDAGGSRADARSFWIAKDDVARCALEHFALEVARFHFEDAESLDRVLGCEYWVQLRKSDDSDANRGLEFHFDKDEDALKTWDVWAHPELATATYIGDGGGAPLVVFATSSDFDDEAEGDNATDGAPSPAKGWLCFPRRGRHATFAGNLLHGVPAELCDLTLPAATAEEQTACATASTKRARSARATREGGASAAKRRKSNAPSPSSSSSLPASALPPAAAPYERISLLVNIWTSHRPEAVERLEALAAPVLDATNADEDSAPSAAPASALAAAGNAADALFASRQVS